MKKVRPDEPKGSARYDFFALQLPPGRGPEGTPYRETPRLLAGIFLRAILAVGLGATVVNVNAYNQARHQQAIACTRERAHPEWLGRYWLNAREAAALEADHSPRLVNRQLSDFMSQPGVTRVEATIVMAANTQADSMSRAAARELGGRLKSASTQAARLALGLGHGAQGLVEVVNESSLLPVASVNTYGARDC